MVPIFLMPLLLNLHLLFAVASQPRAILPPILHSSLPGCITSPEKLTSSRDADLLSGGRFCVGRPRSVPPAVPAPGSRATDCGQVASSSIISDHGRCFNQGHDHDLSPVHVENHCTLILAFHGCLSNFMHMINATWPQCDHVLPKLGTPMFMFEMYAMHACLEACMPTQVHL